MRYRLVRAVKLLTMSFQERRAAFFTGHKIKELVNIYETVMLLSTVGF